MELRLAIKQPMRKDGKNGKTPFAMLPDRYCLKVIGRSKIRLL